MLTWLNLVYCETDAQAMFILKYTLYVTNMQ